MTTTNDSSSSSSKKIEQVHSSLPQYLRPNDLQQKLNCLMDELIPELKAASSSSSSSSSSEQKNCAHTPMADGKWKMPSDVVDSNEEGTKPCFISTIPTATTGEKKNRDKDSPPPIIPDYIWMPKRNGYDLPTGYYHLRTQEAYVQINNLLKKCKPRRQSLCEMLFVHTDPQKDMEDHEYNQLLKQLKVLMFNRLISDCPDDVHAARMKILWMKSGGHSHSNTRFRRGTPLSTLLERAKYVTNIVGGFGG